MKRMKKIMSLLLAVFLLLPVLPCDAFSAVSDDPGETCHTMTEVWFRDNPSLQLTLPGVPRKSQNAVSALLDAYFDSREQSFAAHERIPKKGGALSDGIAALEARAGLVITDAEITTIREMLSSDGHGKSIGLYNVYSRLAICMGKGSTLDIERPAEGGTKAVISWRVVRQDHA